MLQSQYDSLSIKYDYVSLTKQIRTIMGINTDSWLECSVLLFCEAKRGSESVACCMLHTMVRGGNTASSCMEPIVTRTRNSFVFNYVVVD